MSTHASTKIDQKEYLKRYLSGDTNKKKKKKEKKHKHKDAVKVKVIDDDAIASTDIGIDEELLLTGDDAPQIVGTYIEEAPEAPEKKWKSIVIKDEPLDDDVKPKREPEEDMWGPKDISRRIKDEFSPPRRGRKSPTPDISPPRNRSKNKSPRRRNSGDMEHGQRRRKSRSRSRERKKKRDHDSSPSRKQRNSSRDRERDSSPARNRGNKSIKNQSPPNRRRKSNSSDQSPPRRRRNSSSPDHSPPRRRRKSESSDQSPPRRGRKRESSDQSPLRRKTKRRSRSPEKQSSRRTRRESSDQSPPRLKRRQSSDQSPPRLKREKSSDQSPPRRGRKGSPEQSRRRRKNSSDQSPPRRDLDLPPPRRRPPSISPSRIKREKVSPDLSPVRKRHVSRERDQRPDRSNGDSSQQRPSRWQPREPSRSLSPPPTHKKKATKTLDGKKAGLQDAQSLKIENMERRRKEDELFESMPAEMTGRDAEVQIRSTGRRGRRAREAEELDPEEQRRKEIREAEKKERYDRWGRGLKQIEEHRAKIEEQQYEASKPLARYSNDEDLDRHLRDQERADDPMLEYMRKKNKERKKLDNVAVMPTYQGSYPENRFGIRPGYRWDGVDRSNGYEKKWFDVQNEKRAVQDEAYKYSVEDM